MIAYYVGKFGGRRLLDNYGKYVWLYENHLKQAERWFGRYGEGTVFFTRMLPVIRPCISLPDGSGKIGPWIWNLFQSILKERTAIYVSLTAMEHFVGTGTAIVPFIGTYSFPADRRAAYLQRLGMHLADENNLGKIKMMNSSLTNLAYLFVEHLCLIYVINDEYEMERVHVLEANKVSHALEQITAADAATLDFSYDIWTAYQAELLNQV